MVRNLAASLALVPACLAMPQAAASSSCSPLEMVIARGTTEPQMPKYGAVVGDPLFDAVKELVPEVSGYAVNYPASFAKDSKYLGADDASKHIIAQAKACPKQQFVMVGYSQGADVMHGAASKLGKDLYPRIVALVMFGDPGNKGPNAASPLGGIVPPFPKELESKVKMNCAKGDPVCTNSGTVVDDHLVYVEASWITPSAKYIQKQFQSGGKAGAEPSPYGGPNDKGDNSAAMKELGKVLGGSDADIQALQNSAGKNPKKN